MFMWSFGTLISARPRPPLVETGAECSERFSGACRPAMALLMPAAGHDNLGILSKKAYVCVFVHIHIHIHDIHRYGYRC